MRVTRVYVDAPLTTGSRVTLQGAAASHVTRVLRLRVGEALTVFNGSGGEYAASIEHARGGTVAVAIGEARAIERESPLTLTLAERSVVRLTAQQVERRLNHWRAIAIAACEQSGRNRLPAIAAPVPLKDFLRGNSDGSMRLLLSPGATATLADVPRLVTAVTVLIGPEGGLAEAEQEAAVAAGFTPVRLGPRVLRTETAAIAALTLLQREFGDL